MKEITIYYKNIGRRSDYRCNETCDECLLRWNCFTNSTIQRVYSAEHDKEITDFIRNSNIFRFIDSGILKSTTYW